jgi:hypothetical protein
VDAAKVPLSVLMEACSREWTPEQACCRTDVVAQDLRSACHCFLSPVRNCGKLFCADAFDGHLRRGPLRLTIPATVDMAAVDWAFVDLWFFSVVVQEQLDLSCLCISLTFLLLRRRTGEVKSRRGIIPIRSKSDPSQQTRSARNAIEVEFLLHDSFARHALHRT